MVEPFDTSIVLFDNGRSTIEYTGFVTGVVIIFVPNDAVKGNAFILLYIAFT
jgi:hypothetical protein